MEAGISLNRSLVELLSISNVALLMLITRLLEEGGAAGAGGGNNGSRAV